MHGRGRCRKSSFGRIPFKVKEKETRTDRRRWRGEVLVALLRVVQGKDREKSLTEVASSWHGWWCRVSVKTLPISSKPHRATLRVKAKVHRRLLQQNQERGHGTPDCSGGVRAPRRVLHRHSISAALGQAGARKRDSTLTGMELLRGQSSEITKK